MTSDFKTKTSRSAPLNHHTFGHANQADHSHLAQLYPQPKTYEQKSQDNVLRQQSYRRRWPKYPHLNIALYGSIVSGVLLWFMQNVGVWWFSNDNSGVVMSIIFFSFALGLVLAGILIAWVGYVNRQFSYFTGSMGAFWFVVIATIGVMLAVWLSGWIWNYTSILWVPVFVVSYFIATFFAAKATLGVR